MAQLVTRIQAQLVEQVDELVADGLVANRSAAVRLGLEQLVDRHRRLRVAGQIADAYRKAPQDGAELAGIDASTRALIEEEPW